MNVMGGRVTRVLTVNTVISVSSTPAANCAVEKQRADVIRARSDLQHRFRWREWRGDECGKWRHLAWIVAYVRRVACSRSTRTGRSCSNSYKSRSGTYSKLTVAVVACHLVRGGGVGGQKNMKCARRRIFCIHTPAVDGTVHRQCAGEVRAQREGEHRKIELHDWRRHIAHCRACRGELQTS
jgi:hypothetical protein